MKAVEIIRALDEQIEFYDRMIRMKKDWLKTHGPGTKRPWPETDIKIKEDDLKLLKRGANLMELVRGDYQAAVDKKRGRE